MRIPLFLRLLLLFLTVPYWTAQARQEGIDLAPEERQSVVDELRAVALDARLLADEADRVRTRRALERAADRLSRSADDFEAGGSAEAVRDRILDVADRFHGTAAELRDEERARFEMRLDVLIDRLDALVGRLDEVLGDDRHRSWWLWPDRDDPDTRTRRAEARDRWRAARNRIRTHAPAYVGDLADEWPYRETGPYRPMPVVRYNRVDGLVLGVRRLPLDWDSYDRARVYGQAGYAFAMKEWRYEVGGEARLGRPYREERRDVKIGAAFRRDTGTDDLWKVSQAENTVAAFFVRQDWFDYFETEGWTAYGIARLAPGAQVSLAYRSEEHRSLENHATWALFGGDPFRGNPVVDEGRMQSLTVALDGGRIRGYRAVPRGVAFRLTAELGRAMGGDFDFNRYVGDVHGYLRTGPSTGLAVRLRGGTSSGPLPLQRRFTLGGIGSVRAYPQNLISGTEMLLLNAEYSLYGHDLLDGLFDDVVIFGLFDAGWTNGPARAAFAWDDVLPAAGFGVGFGDRTLRLELAFPLRDRGTGMDPTLWLRFSPTL